VVLGNRIKLDDDLLEKVKKCAVMAGYSSPEEFVVHVLEKEVAAMLGSGAESDDEEEVRKRLKGLGYIE
jgi:4-hydroxy-3-methylbut-2-enyl diphosphate reductase IspH